MEPDGRLTVEVIKELADLWGVENQTVVFEFKYYRSWSRRIDGVVVRYGENHPDKKTGYMIIPHSSILSMDVTVNSPEYTIWAREQKRREVRGDGACCS